MSVRNTEYGELSVGSLIGQLYSLANDDPNRASERRAKLAALRLGLGKNPGEAPEVWPVLIPMLGDQQLWQWHERCAYLVASLFASHPVPWTKEDESYQKRTLGSALRALSEAAGSAGVERRFVAMLNSDPDDLGHHLRGLVRLLDSKKIEIDWANLLRDLLRWNHPDRPVQRAWATAFWGGSADRAVDVSGEAEHGKEDAGP